MSGQGSSGTARHRLGVVVAAAALALVCVSGLAFRLTGGHWFVVRTPSMGTVAPVGTLILTRPAAASDLHVGQVIAFHPPSAPSETYTHRIVALSAKGFRTRGDINGATDPWLLTQHDLVGRAVLIAPSWGWLVRGLPLLIIGGVVLWGLTSRWLAVTWRGPVRMVGGSLLLSYVVSTLKPFIAVDDLAVTQTPNGRAEIKLVSTGLLPVRVAARPGHGKAAPVDLQHAGDTGVSVLHGHAAGGRFEVVTHLHLTPVQWVIAFLVCCTPLWWTLLVGYRPKHEPRHRAAVLAVAS